MSSLFLPFLIRQLLTRIHLIETRAFNKVPYKGDLFLFISILLPVANDEPSRSASRNEYRQEMATALISNSYYVSCVVRSHSSFCYLTPIAIFWDYRRVNKQATCCVCSNAHFYVKVLLEELHSTHSLQSVSRFLWRSYHLPLQFLEVRSWLVRKGLFEDYPITLYQESFPTSLIF